MEVKHVDEREYGFFQILEKADPIGKIEYNYQGPTAINIKNTEVDSAHEGQSLGKKLVKYVMDFVKEKNLKLSVDCPFAKAIIHKNPEYQKMLSED